MFWYANMILVQFSNRCLSLWSQRKEDQAPLGSAAAAVPQTRAAAAPVAPLRTAVTPTEHFLFTFFYFLKNIVCSQGYFSSETFYKKRDNKNASCQNIFFFFWKCHEENYRYKKQTNKLLFSFQLTLKGMSKRQSSRRGSLESYFTVQILFPGVLVMLYVAIANLSHPISTDNAENGKLTVFSPDFNSAPVCCIYCLFVFSSSSFCFCCGLIFSPLGAVP